MGKGDRLTFGTFWRLTESWDPVNPKNSPLPIFGAANPTLEFLSCIKYLRSLTPRIFLEASVNFSRKTNNEHWPYSPDKDWSAATGFIGGTGNPIAAGPPYVQVTNYISTGPVNSNPKIWTYNNYQYAASLTWIKGRHSLKFGGDFLRSQEFSVRAGFPERPSRWVYENSVRA